MAFTLGQVLTAAQLNDFAPGTRVQVPDGTVGAPSITNTGDTDTGIFFPGIDDIQIVAGGVARFAVDSGGISSILGIAATDCALRMTHADAAGDCSITFGDQTDAQQAGILWDESLQHLVIRGYNNQAGLTILNNQTVAFENGAVGTPSITFINDANSGFYITGNNGRIDWSGNGVKGGHLNASGVYVVDGTEASPSYSFINATNYGMRQTGTVLRMVTAGADRLEIDSASVSAVDNNSLELGNSVQRWTTVYSVNADDISSDMRLKERTGEPLGLDFVQRLDPFEGTWLDGSDNGRRHQWLSAQNVAEALTDEGIDPHRSTLWRDTDGGQSLAYTELIPVLVRAVQELAERVDA